MAPSDARKTPRPAQSGELPEQLITDVLEAAIAAPSMHNTQPWRFRVLRQAQTIELRADPERALPYGDPGGRGVPIRRRGGALQHAAGRSRGGPPSCGSAAA